jgi:hypothetical protein
MIATQKRAAFLVSGRNQFLVGYASQAANPAPERAKKTAWVIEFQRYLDRKAGTYFAAAYRAMNPIML